MHDERTDALAMQHLVKAKAAGASEDEIAKLSWI
jgi:hypothetical protein